MHLAPNAGKMTSCPRPYRCTAQEGQDGYLHNLIQCRRFQDQHQFSPAAPIRCQRARGAGGPRSGSRSSTRFLSRTFRVPWVESCGSVLVSTDDGYYRLSGASLTCLMLLDTIAEQSETSVCPCSAHGGVLYVFDCSSSLDKNMSMRKCLCDMIHAFFFHCQFSFSPRSVKHLGANSKTTSPFYLNIFCLRP